jgi:hypothetical protein
MTFPEFQQQFKDNNGKVVVQTVIGRAGSLFLQSLLDNHPQVLMYPGVLNFYESMWRDVSKKPAEWKSIVKEKIILWNNVMVPYNIHQNLGEGGNETININPDEIVSIMEGSGSPGAGRRIFFLLLHYAVGVYFKKDLASVRVIYIHEHTVNVTGEMVAMMSEDFPDCKIICMVRNPLTNYPSIVNWERKRQTESGEIWKANRYIENIFMDMGIFWYKRFLKVINSHHSNFVIIRLEDMQKHRQDYLQKICRLLAISDSETLNHTTFLGKEWHGDNFSPRQKGFRQSALASVEKSKLESMKQSLIIMLLKGEMNALGYELNAIGIFTRVKLWIIFPFWNFPDYRKIFSLRYYAYMKKVKGKNFISVLILDIKLYLLSCRSLFKATLSSPAGEYNNIRRIIL